MLLSSVVLIFECLLKLFQIQILDMKYYLNSLLQITDPVTLLWIFLGLFPLSIAFSFVKNLGQSLCNILFYFLFKFSLNSHYSVIQHGSF